MIIKRPLALVKLSLAFIGLGFLGNGLYLPLKAELAQALIEASWDQRNQGQAAPKPWPWADIHAVAALEVPALQQKHFVMNDASGEALAFGPGKIPSTAQISGSGHVVIAGHRDTHFEFLQDVRLGQIVRTTRFDGTTARYRVVEIRVLDVDQESIPVYPEQDLLTLITCYPFNKLAPRGSLRWMVSAEVEQPAATLSEASRSTKL